MSKFKTIKNEFAEPQALSGGNKYDVYNQLKVQKYIDIMEANSNGSYTLYENKIKELTKQFITDKTINPYYLLHLQGNYFCGTCKFECDDYDLKHKIINVIRGAFLYGKAGLYYDNVIKKWVPVYIEKMDIDIAGDLTSVTYGSLFNALSTEQAEPKLQTFTIKNKELLKNMYIFKWGTMSFGAYLYIYPFVKFQKQLLDMSIIQSFSFNKKYIYKVNNLSAIGNEMSLYFDNLNPFMVSLNNNSEVSNRFETIEAGGNSQADSFLDYYNKVIGIYYHIIGRRVNNDEKKERNITSEVEASQENYDIVQSDWLNQFEIFINRVKENPNFKGVLEVTKDEVTGTENDEQFGDNVENTLPNGSDNNEY